MASTQSNDMPLRPRLIDELRAGRREFLKTYGPGLIVTVMGFVIAFYFVEPPPPNELTIADGFAHAFIAGTPFCGRSTKRCARVVRINWQAMRRN